jgi:hypothetical protein
MEARITFIMFKMIMYEKCVSFISFFCEYFWKKIRDLWVNNNKNCVV